MTTTDAKTARLQPVMQVLERQYSSMRLPAHLYRRLAEFLDDLPEGDAESPPLPFVDDNMVDDGGQLVGELVVFTASRVVLVNASHDGGVTVRTFPRSTLQQLVIAEADGRNSDLQWKEDWGRWPSIRAVRLDYDGQAPFSVPLSTDNDERCEAFGKFLPSLIADLHVR